MSGPLPPVMVLEPEAEDYATLIGHETGQKVPITVCHTAGQARAGYEGQPVVLGAPDLVAEVVGEWPGVRWVQSTWAGVRPLLEAGRRDYVLTGIKGVFGPAMSEYVVGHLLARELDVVTRAAHQRRHEWFDAASGTLRGKRAGILGTGSIGRHIAGTLAGFGVKVLGLSRSGRPARPFERVYARDQLEAFLQGLDYVVCTLPDTPDTHHLLDASALGALPPHAVLVNVGRGRVLDSRALADALRNDRLGGAVLDVFETEPLPADSPLWDVPNLTVTAHVAARSFPAEIAPIFLRNYRRFAAGEALHHVVEFDRGY